MCTSLNVPEEKGTSRLDNASNLRLYQSVELPKSRIWFRQIGDYENLEERGITGTTPKTISQSQTFISSPRFSGTLKSKSHLKSITESKRHRPASKQWTTQAASHGFDISFFDLVSPKHGST
jgi:hypothetical protein